MMKAKFDNVLRKWVVSFYDETNNKLFEYADVSLNVACANIFRMKTEG